MTFTERLDQVRKELTSKGNDEDRINLTLELGIYVQDEDVPVEDRLQAIGEFLLSGGFPNQ